MNNLIDKIESLKKSSVKQIIDSRIKEFEKINPSPDKIFSELCFCLMTANFQAEKSIFIQKNLEKEFVSLKEEELAKRLREFGHRFPNMRSKFIVEARKFRMDLINNLDRDWLVKNIKGLGMKESSHFLRNIGKKNYAIIDFHIIDLLKNEKLIGKIKKPISKNKYLKIEKILDKIAQKTKLTQAELDLYLWFIQTGKILK